MAVSIFERVYHHLCFIYRDEEHLHLDPNALLYPASELEQISHELLAAMRIAPEHSLPGPDASHKWDQTDIAMISYGDSIAPSQASDKTALQILGQFLDQQLEGAINTLHILPFNPFTSDDGFAVSDYLAVRAELGTWSDINALAEHYRLMGDLVINHCSASHPWVEAFKQAASDDESYIFTAEPSDDLSQVVRPRTNPLLQAMDTTRGTRHAWCTFSEDQIDLNFKNPRLLLEIVKIIRRYLDEGIRIFRLDAIAFLWKKPGSNCLNLPETHEVVRLLRTLSDCAVDDAVIITETNIPNQENLSYFGNLNEAHWIYNFSLPPLLLNTLVSGNSHYLKLWMMSMPPAQHGTGYFNFIASHDGIGLRPTEGLLSSREIDSLIALMENFGGKVSYRALENGESKPYEINISLFDALQGTYQGPDELNVERFICAHAIMLALEGIPAFYIHSLLGTKNDYERMDRLDMNRAINRHQWSDEEITAALNNEKAHHQQVFSEMKRLIGLRKQQAAFHPNATQFTLHLDDSLFGFWRQSMDRSQSIFCISNIDRKPQRLPLESVNLISTDTWFDLISGNDITAFDATIELAPYQTVWITNRGR